ncbi:MAG: peptide chain release factor N(5)-glutamine methyltransferase [Candidatus Lightella neohaematopini]|nr:peptide chain release factor N(5)-glutamine methyltransferase [Candidatus Lightella neohaematopini]MCV2529013.1 peptide chain release factor N(5)-glutamine methyltransferase [Candidatus Lightella neohaematopini]
MTINNVNYCNWLKYASNKLLLAGINNPKLEAEILLCQVTNNNRSKLILLKSNYLTCKQYNKLMQLVFRRINREPLAYIIGYHEFWSLKIYVSCNTMIPRADTECLVEHILNFSSKKKTLVLDLGTGSGTISLALAKERPKWKITSTDYCIKILNVAKYNAIKLKLYNIKFILSNWFNNITFNNYDIIISNPPYLKNHDWYNAQPELYFEPKTAFLAGYNGLIYLKLICYQSKKFLSYNGWLLLEHDYRQGNFVRNMLKETGFKNIGTGYDYSNRERFSFGQLL